MNHTPPLSPQPLIRERQWTQDGFPVLTLRLSLPHSGGTARRLRRIDRCYLRFARCYESYCARFLLPPATAAFHAAVAAHRPFDPWAAEAGYRLTLLTPELLSLTLELREPEADGTRLCRRRGDTWDLRDGYPLALGDFFPRDPLPLRRLRRLAREELPHRGGTLRPDWRLRLHTAGGAHFYLTEAGLAFFYPMYALGDAALGIPEFLLPWEDTEGLSLPEGISSLRALDKGDAAALS